MASTKDYLSYVLDLLSGLDMVDRLTFQSYILDMNGQSYRLEQAKKQKR